MTPENSRLGWSGVGVVKEKRVKLRISRIYCSHTVKVSKSRWSGGEGIWIEDYLSYLLNSITQIIKIVHLKKIRQK